MRTHGAWLREKAEHIEGAVDYLDALTAQGRVADEDCMWMTMTLLQGRGALLDLADRLDREDAEKGAVEWVR